MLQSKGFNTLKDPETLRTVWLEVQDLGISRASTTDQVYSRANELGLELCPAETGPHMRLCYTDQPMRGLLSIGMKQIAGLRGYLGVFNLVHYESDLWLAATREYPDFGWDAGAKFVFSLRK